MYLKSEFHNIIRNRGITRVVDCSTLIQIILALSITNVRLLNLYRKGNVASTPLKWWNNKERNRKKRRSKRNKM